MASKKTTEKEPVVDQAKAEIDYTNISFIFNFMHEAEKIDNTKKDITKGLEQIIGSSGLRDKYQFIFLYDKESIARYTADRIYEALTAETEKSKDILMVLYSFGGEVEPAYLISKCCKERSKDSFVVAIPRQAKSAATLLAIGADQIHMGPMSELGPIDPQIGNYPALALKEAVEYIVELGDRYPGAAELLAKYLGNSLSLRNLGYSQRVSQSSVQYAERLLKNKNFSQGHDATSIANRLVYEYKDHSFVIDKDEARSFLGDGLVKYKTPEYYVADALYRYLDLVAFAASIFKNQKFKLVGNIDGGLSFAPEDSQ